jgi:hypothetical protein
MLNKTFSSRFVLSVAFCVFLGTNFISAQSADRNNPTRITTREISGEAVASNTEYFYSLAAGPGELTITPEVTSNDFSTAFSVELIDSRNGGNLGKTSVIATGKNSEIGTVKKFQIARRQNLLLRLTFDGNAGNFKVKLGGAGVNLPSSNGGNNVQATNNSDVSMTPRQTSGPRRVLRIEMIDGSAQEFDLERVTQITVRPN